jgi:hypothetical protein
MKHACLPVGCFPTERKIRLAGLFGPKVIAIISGRLVEGETTIRDVE